MTNEQLINDNLLMIRGFWWRTYVRTTLVVKSLSRLKIEAIKTLQDTLSTVCKNFDYSVFETLEEIPSKEEKSVQSTSKYFCHLCSLDLGKGERYRKHMNKHSGKFKCNDCGKCFQDGNDLRRHTNKQFSCLDIKRENRKNPN